MAEIPATSYEARKYELQTAREKIFGEEKKTFERELLGFPLPRSTILVVLTPPVSLTLLLSHVCCKVFVEIENREIVCMFCARGGIEG